MNNSRPLKFRIWKSETKQWVDFPNRGIASFESIIDDVYTDCDYFVVQQFTGLLDQNGKEIYEGDIVLWPQEGKRYEIFFDSKTASFSRRCADKIGLEGNEHSWELWEMVGIEVIGNIFENPELLS